MRTGIHVMCVTFDVCACMCVLLLLCKHMEEVVFTCVLCGMCVCS